VAVRIVERVQFPKVVLVPDDHARCVEAALQVYANGSGNSSQEATLVYLLEDLMYWADKNGVEFGYAFARAFASYEAASEESDSERREALMEDAAAEDAERAASGDEGLR
jgi:hypothetical protein